ncbi:hypothetical protein [uncultured Enterovirga sp.]
MRLHLAPIVRMGRAQVSVALLDGGLRRFSGGRSSAIPGVVPM